MIRVVVSYPNTSGARFDLDYYMKKHMPMVQERLRKFGMSSYSVSKGLGGFEPGAPAEFMVTAQINIDTMENLQAGMASESSAIMSDIPNYTDIQPHIQIDEVLA